MKKTILIFVVLFSFCSSRADTTSLTNYRNRIMKIYLNGSSLDEQLNAAIKTKNPVDIETARQKLLDFVSTGMKQLDSVGNFEDDASLKFSCRDVFLFYKQLTEYDIPQVRDFYVTELNFLVIKRDFEKKKVKKHTEQEILAYNQEVKKYNDALVKFTQLSTFIDNARKQTLYNWESSEKIFTRSHMFRS